MTLRQMVRELVATGPGKAGLVLLAVLAGISLYAVATFPPGYGTQRWSNPAAWADNPKAAPPAWTDFLSGRNAVRHTVLRVSDPVGVSEVGGRQIRSYSARFEFDADEVPTLVSASVWGVSYHGAPPVLAASVVRPDGSEVVLVRHAVSAPRPGEAMPYRRYQDEVLRLSLTGDARAVRILEDFLLDEYGVEADPDQVRDAPELALMGEPDPHVPGGLRPLHGSYDLVLRVTLADPRDRVDGVSFTVGGSVFGLMGTDSLGRDLAAGLLFGLPVALFIGMAASVTTTAIGATLGVISGYVGGKTDLVIQRAADVLANVPLLPLLIFLVFVLGPHLLLIIALLVGFSWPGLTIVLRSMVLQLRSGQLVEAAVVLGASKWRIMYRYVFPHTAPFVFAQMIFFTPAAILAEAGLSFLGLGDPSIPTWGQILHQGFQTGAVFLGWWWWVIPPGVLIVITAVTFMLLALGMEPAVNPRLRSLAPARRAADEAARVE